MGVNNSSPENGHGAERIRVLIADDHAMVRTGLRMILEDEPDIEVVGEAADGKRALELALRVRPTVVLADVSMPPPDGIELARLLCRDLPDTKTLLVSMHEEEELVRSGLASGAAGYVAKRSGPDELLKALRSVARGNIYVDQKMRVQVME